GGSRLTPGACLSPRLHAWLGDRLVIGLGESVPHSQRFSVLELGDLRILAWPGEPTTGLGFGVQGAPGAGGKGPWVFGLTNGYQGYFTTPEEFTQGGYEACSSLYGARGGEQALGAVRSLLR